MSGSDDRRDDFSATDVAFAGFRLAGRDPGSIVAWGLLALLMGVIAFGAMAAILAPSFNEWRTTLTPGQPVDAKVQADFLRRMAPTNLISVLLGIIFYPLLLTGVYRAVLEPRRAFGHLQLGRDEFVQFLALALVWIVMAAVYLVAVFAVIFGATFVFVTVSHPAGVFAGVLGGILGVCLLIFLAVRLSLVGPASFDHGALRVGEAWRLTRGRFWALLGAYVLSVVMGMLAALGFLLVFAVIVLLAVLASRSFWDASTPATYYAAAAILFLYVLAVSMLNGFLYAVMFAPAAEAYRRLTQPAPPLPPGSSHMFGTPFAG